MLTKCSNPSCYAPFRSLQGGRLFRLESDPQMLTSRSTRAEYFWLCQHCSSTMTLRIGDGGAISAVLLPEPIRGVPDGVGLVSMDRKKGLLLRTVSFTLPEHFRDRGRPPNRRPYVA